jgi:hypothetical protein
MATSASVGGRRPGAGRKALDGARDLRRISVFLGRLHIDQAAAAGDGNVSLGVRRLLSGIAGADERSISADERSE